MVHRIVWRVGSDDALAFWRERLAAHGVEVESTAEGVLFADPEGLAHELLVTSGGEEPLIARSHEIPGGLALQGFAGVRVYSSEPADSARFLGDALGFTSQENGSGWQARGERRSGFYVYDTPPEGRGRRGAGTVHHVAFAAQAHEVQAWRERLAAAGARPTEVIDRFYFRSVYFFEPSGVLCEIATIGPGFGVDEDEGHLGERLSLPPQFEPLRARIESVLTPLPDPPAGGR
jgi:glyoxalase family protein